MKIMESTGVEGGAIKRRARSKQERRGIVEETFTDGMSVASVAGAKRIRASQVYHWRRQYYQGLLGDEITQTTTLVPVRITDTAKHRRAPASATTEVRRPASKVGSGTIQVELEKARVSIHGAADPASLRGVLEFLLR